MHRRDLAALDMDVAKIMVLLTRVDTCGLKIAIGRCLVRPGSTRIRVDPHVFRQIGINIRERINRHICPAHHVTLFGQNLHQISLGFLRQHCHAARRGLEDAPAAGTTRRRVPLPCGRCPKVVRLLHSFALDHTVVPLLVLCACVDTHVRELVEGGLRVCGCGRVWLQVCNLPARTEKNRRILLSHGHTVGEETVELLARVDSLVLEIG
mmetsp:Transcript_61710/g.90486  ORF Transcript_61710/g.90486 Transcript_61710/m.90486 type:complete len:209 (-) Transcript_61710:493-1119(-)